ncbi:BrnT family toxin [Candidatus Amarolinea aalborgensis]|uniref:BrnT family toxin n=1 Tax=Candidatus Amarolinea aalborgensis TaxID=2249329 RepID=UPI003BF94EF3
MPYRFEWDSRQAATNIRKHGVSFDEASSVFDDPLAVIFDDDTHSASEVRELIIGHSVTGRLLLVGFTERPGERLRLISARVTTKKERQDYEDYHNA